jgi:hypothetical protein
MPEEAAEVDEGLRFMLPNMLKKGMGLLPRGAAPPPGRAPAAAGAADRAGCRAHGFGSGLLLGSGPISCGVEADDVAFSLSRPSEPRAPEMAASMKGS